jgi:hypothetical protein
MKKYRELFVIKKTLLSLTLIFSPMITHSEVQEFIKPSSDGIRLDWCLSYSADCGEQVAYK